MTTEFGVLDFEIFPWNSNFIVGIDFIDEQHKKLVELLNKVIAQFITGNDRQANEAALTELIEYARYHFDEEEKLWQKYFGTVALANDHAKTHDLFFTEIQTILDAGTDGHSITDKLIEYLTNWLAVHILHNDRRMALMVLEIQSKGVSLLEAERAAKTKIIKTPILQSSIVELYKKLSNSASQLIREKNARLQAESQLQLILKEKAELALEMQAKEYQAHLEFLAYNDPLTGLLNGNGLLRELRKMMGEANNETDSIAVIAINLDYFGQISSQLGSEGTNHLLGILAKRWQDTLMPNGALAHLGSDDFVVLLRNVSLIEEQLNAMRLAASQTFFIDEWRNTIAFTAGYCVYPPSFIDRGLDAEKLQRQAEYALFQAKQSARGTSLQFDFEEERNLRVKNDRILRIREGFANEEFRLYYQPKTNMRTGEIIGAEALIRWQHPDRGLLEPLAFLPVLDNHPFIIDLGEWVIDKAIQHILMWQKEELVLTVSVNVDALQIQDPLFPLKLREILDRYPFFKPEYLDLEILETVAINDIDVAISNICQCKKYGVSFSLDDFGKGYCSLSYLKKLPVDTLKIDQAFVRNMLDDATNISILEGIIAIAKTFNLKIIAEGVESVMHGEFLIQIGCEFAQGYAIGRPMAQSLFLEWQKQWKTYPQWSNANTLRRDDVVALTGLAELNKWLKTIETQGNNHLPSKPKNEFHSKSLEKWIRTSLEALPNQDISTVHQIESNYNNLLVLAKKMSEDRDANVLTPNTDDFLDLNESFKTLTKQIRVGLQDCLDHRNKRQNRQLKSGV